MSCKKSTIIKNTEHIYTNAKVLFTGDGNAGKTGLVFRLAEGCFKSSVSNDHNWSPPLRMLLSASLANIEKEIWLWDLPGQSDYRLMHQLFMEGTILVILVFDPQNENLFEELEQWDNDLERAASSPIRKLLVAGRCDRGSIMVSHTKIEQFLKEHNFAGYLETSAKNGDGCDKLHDAILHNIVWKKSHLVTSQRQFNHLKDIILEIKVEGNLLLSIAELNQQLKKKITNEIFSIDEIRDVACLLNSAGVLIYLKINDLVLLEPEFFNIYATAIIRTIRTHLDEIGCIPEACIMTGQLNYNSTKRLPAKAERILLQAMNQLFADRKICFHENTEKGLMLVFPPYFNQEWPEPNHSLAVHIAYQFSEPINEIYATLIVHLCHLRHTPEFEIDQSWRLAASFKTQDGKGIGFKMVKKNKDEGEIIIFFDPAIPDEINLDFIRHVHSHLKNKDPNVVRVPYYSCPHCNSLLESNKAIEIRIENGLKDIVCAICEKRVLLLDLIEEKFISDKFLRQVREMEERADIKMDNQSRELVLLGCTFKIAGEAGQIFRPTSNSDWGIDGEIEFKDYAGNASGRRVYIQLKSGDSYLYKSRKDGTEVFMIKNSRHAEYWQQQAYPVMLVIRTSDGSIRWMNVTSYLNEQSKGKETPVKRIVFQGEPFNALNLQRLRDKLIPPPR